MQILRSVRCLLLALLVLIIPASSLAGVFVSVTVAPPGLPVYEQPPCPGDGYMWTPGYWAYGPDGYYWVPGTWVMPPAVGLLWTPGYWGWNEGVYVWHAGYWGPHIGFYGGVNYGFGYFGNGYDGGYWRGRTFYYNRTVNNIHITNVHIYNKTVINNVNVNRVSYNGGHGGIMARPTHEQDRWAHEHHFEPTHMQMQHEHAAGGNRAFRESENHGRPPVAATARPGEFHGRGVDARAGAEPARRFEDRATPRRPNTPPNVDRPMARQGEQGRWAPRPENNNPRHAEAGPRPSAYRPDNARPEHGRPENARPQNVHQENAHPHGNTPGRGNESHSNKGHDEKQH